MNKQSSTLHYSHQCKQSSAYFVVQYQLLYLVQGVQAASAGPPPPPELQASTCAAIRPQG